MKVQSYIIGIFLIGMSMSCHAQSQAGYSATEKEYHQLFNSFKQYLVSSIAKNGNASDSATLKEVSLNYLFVNARLDSNNKRNFSPAELSIKQFQNFQEQYRHLYQFLVEREKNQLASHLTAMPIRLSKDQCIYQKLSAFQKENTFVYFDDRKPDQVLGYMLFVPRIKGKLSASRIMSWTLMFDSGLWAFKSVIGEAGFEYFISEGIQGPGSDKRIK